MTSQSVTTPPQARGRFLPSLDGLRALAVLLVIALHSLQRLSMTQPVSWWWLALGNGALGVFLFFIISGYLITTLLVRELAKTGHISLRGFYARRAFRILPPLYAYIAFITVLGLTGHMPGFNRTELWTALTLTRNYSLHASLWSFEHLWSLCIEEQFYLLWPGVLVLSVLAAHRAMSRTKSRAKSSAISHSAGSSESRSVSGLMERVRVQAAWVALLVICIEPFVRLFCFRYLPLWHNMGSFHMQADALMFGAIAALLEGRARFERLFARATRLPWLVPVALFLCAALGIRFGNYWMAPIGLTLEGLLGLTWILWLVRHPDSLQGRVLNQPAIMWVGRLSYSLYLWQTFFLHHDNVTVLGHATWWSTLPGAWLAISLCGVTSYYLIEQPALRLRARVLRAP
jgi:peptidoglycan/LPS O-acetylase OafA/YrhL